MMLSVGSSHPYRFTGYASGAAIGAARTAMSRALSAPAQSVTPITKTPEVFSNTETVRAFLVPEELQAKRAAIFDAMRFGTPRNAGHINAPSELEPECETCKNRTYVDGSNEGNVSFKTPGHISAKASASVVRAHEYEHVSNALAEDRKPDAKLLSVSVTLKTAICPECGSVYVAGGETKTSIRRTKQTPEVQEDTAVQAGQKD